jgi:hypothetical protein
MKDILFTTNPIPKMTKDAGLLGIEIPDLADHWGLELSYRLRDDFFEAWINDTTLFADYVSRLSPVVIEKLLKNDQLERFHIPIWNITLPLFLEEAKELKINHDEDHKLFSLAKLLLHPPHGIKWQRLSDAAKYAYKSWSIGTQLESVFESDRDNKRISFWKRKITDIDEVIEIQYRGETGALAMTIGKYQFVEFKDIGAIYVYQANRISIPRRVSNLAELKHKTKVIRPGFGTQNGEGWIAHQGTRWPHYADKLVKEALKR